MRDDIFTSAMIDEAIEKACGLAPYLYGLSCHNYDLRDRSVSRDIMIDQVDYPDPFTVIYDECVPVRMAALGERMELWREYYIPWYLVMRARGYSP